MGFLMRGAWRRARPIMVFASLFVLMAQPAAAQALDPIQEMLETVISFMTGGIGRAIAILAVVAVGFACFLGRVPWVAFALLLVGVVLIFSAPTIIDGF